MKKDGILPGTVVETRTVSGQKILCTVIRREGVVWELDSPEHGYGIWRYRNEFKIVPSEKKEP